MWRAIPVICGTIKNVRSINQNHYQTDAAATLRRFGLFTARTIVHSDNVLCSFLDELTNGAIMSRRTLVCVIAVLATAGDVYGSDWTRFRGPNGTGVSPDTATPPTEWSDSTNVKWKITLPGPGLSSPIIIGDRVIVTCWTGYAAGGDDQGSIEDMKRQVVCLDRKTGDTIWTHSEDPVLPEDNYRGMFAENGYASHTPATDGERVYAFFGKTGVVALNLSDGKKLWQKSVGENLEDKGWGSASSPIIHDGKVIVSAFIEGDAMVAFDGKTGDVIWEQKTPGYRSNWSTPVLVDTGERVDLVMAVPGEVWGLNPDNGKLKWYCEIEGSDSARASVIADGDIVIAMSGGRGATTSIAVKAGGKGAVESVWTGRDVSSTGTPVVHDGRMYLVSNKVVTSVDMATGKRIGQTRLTGAASPAEGNAGAERPPGGDGERGGRPPEGGGRGGYGGGRGPGGQDYSSPVVAGNQLYYAARSGDVFVVALGEEVKQVASNKFAADSGQYSSTPAISNGELFIRSSTTLYCIAAGS
jgi:outer membrane protein assembly factor BamB